MHPHKRENGRNQLVYSRRTLLRSNENEPRPPAAKLVDLTNVTKRDKEEPAHCDFMWCKSEKQTNLWCEKSGWGLGDGE